MGQVGSQRAVRKINDFHLTVFLLTCVAELAPKLERPSSSMEPVAGC